VVIVNPVGGDGAALLSPAVIAYEQRTVASGGLTRRLSHADEPLRHVLAKLTPLGLGAVGHAVAVR